MRTKKMKEPLLDYDEENGFFAISVRDILGDLNDMDELIEELSFNSRERCVDGKGEHRITELLKKIKMSLNSARELIQTSKERQTIDALRGKMLEYMERFREKKDELEDEFMAVQPGDEEEEDEEDDDILLKSKQAQQEVNLDVQKMDDFVEERHHRIRKFKETSKQIHDIALDINTEIEEQGTTLDSMNKNFDVGTTNMENANEQMEELVRKMRMRKFCLKLIICLMILSIVIILIFVNKVFN